MSVEERINRQSEWEPVSGCRIWTGNANQKGYGQMRFLGHTMNAHRAVYIVANGPLPDGFDVDHLCRNRACINLAHLEPVPRRVNILRGIGISAMNAAKSLCVRGHEFTDANIYLYKGKRYCRACKDMRQKESRAKAA